MKFEVALSALIAVTLIGNATASIPLAGIINLGLRVIMNNLISNGNITQEGSTPIIIPESMKDFMVGSLHLDNLTIYGLRGLKFTTKATDISSTDPDFSRATVNLALSLDKLGVLTGYDVDIGIIDEIPVYGAGEINLAVSKVKVGVNVDVIVKSDLSSKRISNLDLQLAFFDSPGSITGFWKNDKASEFLTGIINILEKFLCMWYTYERDCIDCVLGEIIEFAVNIFLNFKGGKLLFGCECLKNDEYRLKELMENIGNSYASEGMEGVEKYLTSEDVLAVLENIYKRVVRIVTESLI